MTDRPILFSGPMATLTKRQSEVLTKLANDPLGVGFCPNGSGEWQLMNRLHEKKFVRVMKGASWAPASFEITDAGRAALSGQQ